MKLLRESVIASKNFNKILETFKFSQVFVKEVILLNAIFGVVSFFLFHISLDQLFILITSLLILDIFILFLIGKKRRNEINEIKNVIKAIRKNKIKNENEILLSKSLNNLEYNIKAMYKRTQEDIKRMEKLAQARSEFLGYVSHELRTPIFAIQGFLETLLNGALDDPKVNRLFIQKAFTHSENLNRLLNDLINISMIESGLMKLSFRVFNLYNFLEKIINEFNEIKNDDVELLITPFNKDLEVYADKERLYQVMENLISNSLKYTQKGKVEIIVAEGKKYISISVKDTGIGIHEDDLERIFERFYRTEREREGGIPGTGLGLSIVKHILEAHHSKIKVESELNKGSRFTFHLKRV